MSEQAQPNADELIADRKAEKTARRVLEVALQQKFEAVAVLGFTADGGIYVTASCSHGGDVLWLMEAAKMALLEAAKKETTNAVERKG